MRANGNANIPGAIMTIGAVVNLILDPIFIFGWFGFPAMELAGAATAMTLTRFGMLVVSLWFISWGQNGLGNAFLPDGTTQPSAFCTLAFLPWRQT